MAVSSLPPEAKGDTSRGPETGRGGAVKLTVT